MEEDYLDLHIEDGQRLRVAVASGTYDSQVVDITPTTILITSLIAEDRLVPLQQGEPMQVFYLDEFQQRSFQTSLKERDPRLPLLLLERPRRPKVVTVQVIEPLRPGQSLKVDILTDERMEVFDSRVMEVQEDRILISPLLDPERHLVPLSPGDRVRVYYRGEVAKYLFDADVLERREGSRPGEWQFLLSPPETVRLMARQHRRVRMFFPPLLKISELKKTTPEHYYTTDFSEILDGKVIDLSESGVKVLSPSPLKIGTEILLSFTLPNGLSIHSEGKIARCQKLKKEGVEAFVSGVSFSRISERDRERIRNVVEESGSSSVE